MKELSNPKQSIKILKNPEKIEIPSLQKQETEEFYQSMELLRNTAIEEAQNEGYYEYAPAFIAAVKEGELDLVQKYIALGVNPAYHYNQAIMFASKYAYQTQPKIYSTSNRLNPREIDIRYGQTPEFIKTHKHNCREIVKLLLADKRVDPFSNNNYVARNIIEADDLEAMKLVLKHPDLNKKLVDKFINITKKYRRNAKEKGDDLRYKNIKSLLNATLIAKKHTTSLLAPNTKQRSSSFAEKSPVKQEPIRTRRTGSFDSPKKVERQTETPPAVIIPRINIPKINIEAEIEEPKKENSTAKKRGFLSKHLSKSSIGQKLTQDPVYLKRVSNEQNQLTNPTEGKRFNLQELKTKEKTKAEQHPKQSFLKMAISSHEIN